MTNKEILKKKIIYRSMHRGTKEMDLLLGSFVERYINTFTTIELEVLERLLLIEDELISKWYFNRDQNEIIPINKVSSLLKNFKL